MGQLVNLRKARKEAARRQEQLQAAENRSVYGRSKAERMLGSAQTAKSRRDLEAHRIETGEEI